VTEEDEADPAGAASLLGVSIEGGTRRVVPSADAVRGARRRPQPAQRAEPEREAGADGDRLVEAWSQRDQGAALAAFRPRRGRLLGFRVIARRFGYLESEPRLAAVPVAWSGGVGDPLLLDDERIAWIEQHCAMLLTGDRPVRARESFETLGAAARLELTAIRVRRVPGRNLAVPDVLCVVEPPRV